MRMKDYSIYFGDNEVVVTTKSPNSQYAILDVDTSYAIPRAKIVKKVETDKFVAIVTPDTDATFDSLKSQFKVVLAAGGVVESDDEQLLMIELRNRWDLPKGHIEAGESESVAALREVEEETGVAAEIIGDEPIAVTWHAYDTYGSWELKRTSWWRMRADAGAVTPQREEGIAKVIWCAKDEVEEQLKNSYPTIKRVVGALQY
ncbi:MAG: NUDIX domain-containing protein [Alistipes sp.]|nr:NUDIX domain-containing protein [Alistipes sp.]